MYIDIEEFMEALATHFPKLWAASIAGLDYIESPSPLLLVGEFGARLTGDISLLTNKERTEIQEIIEQSFQSNESISAIVATGMLEAISGACDRMPEKWMDIRSLLKGESLKYTIFWHEG